MNAASTQLDRRIFEFIQTPNPPDGAFDPLALDLFAYQFARNQPYRRYCEQVGRDPSNVIRGCDIPAIPAMAFAQARLVCFEPARTRLTFLSSGTTRGKPSRHELENSTLYDASLLAHFRRCVLPDRDRIRLIALAQSFDAAPSSSLSYMLSKISSVFGTSRDGFYLGDRGLDFDGASTALGSCSEPALVIGTAFAFVHFIDACDRRGLRFELPFGSRIVETGGFKSRSREIARDALYESLSRIFGVPRVLCASEYGMCELGSQWYDANIADYFAGITPRTQIKVGPHWARTLVVDPVSGEAAPSGAHGLLQHFDLSNRGSVSAVLTGDLGRLADGGFEFLGRLEGGPPKGCSIAVDALLSARD